MENSSYADALLADIERTASKDGRLFMVQGAYMADDEAGAAEVRKVMDSIKVE